MPGSITLQKAVDQYKLLVKQRKEKSFIEIVKKEEFIHSFMQILPYICLEQNHNQDSDDALEYVIYALSRAISSSDYNMSDPLYRLSLAYRAASTHYERVPIRGLLDGLTQPAEKTAHIMCIITLLLKKFHQASSMQNSRLENLVDPLEDIALLCNQYKDFIDFSFGSGYQVPEDIQTRLIKFSKTPISVGFKPKSSDKDIIVVLTTCNFLIAL